MEVISEAPKMEVALNQDTRTSDDENSFASEVDTDVEDGLKATKPRHQFSDVIVPVLTKDGDPSENNAYLDKYGGAIEDLNIQKVQKSVQNDANNNGETENETETEIVTETVINGGRGVIKAKSEQIEEEIVEEEVVELEFEKAIPKLHTHTMHCPNCDYHITKVVLRRKIIRKQRPAPVTEQPHEPLDLLGCFSCFSLFTSADNGGFSPFPIFGNNKPTSSVVPGTDGNGVVSEDGNCFSIFRVFRREKDSQQPKSGEVVQDSDHPSPPTAELEYILNKLPIRQGENSWPEVEGGPSKPEYQPRDGGVPTHYDQLHLGVILPAKDESSIDILPDTSLETHVPPQGSTGQDSTSFEILKSIVYGGLMEVIASLSIVASAAGGDATTLSIVALALANLIGGIFVIGHNLWDLKDDCYKFYNQQTSNDQEARNKYKELLGSVEHFPLHVFFAILSFLVFGVIPPVAYGYSFNKTNDTDFTMLIVAGASFVCVGLLATFKARIDRCTGFSGYVKTIVYYLTTAVAVSGVSYAAGNLAKRLIVELGLFETSSNGAMAVFTDVVSMNPSVAYY